MNYLIFGGEGFIGQHLISYLTTEKKISPEQVFSLDIKRKSEYSNFRYTDVRNEIDLDIEDLEDSLIFNLAAIHTTPGHPDNEYFEANIRGAENICAFAEQHRINSVAFTSSIAPYGASEENKTEISLPMPNTPYGISKLVAEHIFRTWQAKDPSSRRLSIVRPGVVFGKGEGGNFTRLYNAQKRGFFLYPGRKDTLKASVYVKDVTRILYDTITSDTLDHNVCLYNLTYYPAPSIEEICNTISDVTGVSKPGIVLPGGILKIAANVVYLLGAIFGIKFNGIHPDRVKKLMVSTNISGKRLEQSEFRVRYPLRKAVEDWMREGSGRDLI